MGSNDIGDDGMSSIANGLQYNKSLTKLNIQNCGLSAKGKIEFKIICSLQFLCGCGIAIAIYVTRHEKAMLMYTKYTALHYLNYFTFRVSYTGSVNCIGFPIVCSTFGEGFIETPCLNRKLLKFEVQKSCQILCT